MRPMLAASLVVSTGLAVAPDAGAQARVTLVPSLSVSSVYDDNLFARRQGDAGEMTVFRPSLDATYEAPRLTLQGIGSFDMLRSNHEALNTLDARRNAYLDTRFRSTPYTTLMLAARYDQTETPGELNIESGILSDRQRARRFQATPSLSHRLGERTTISGSYDWTTEGLAGADQIDLHIARASYARRWSTRDSLTFGFLGRRFVDDLGVESSNALLLGWTHELAFATQLTLQAGPRVTSYAGVAPETIVAFIRSTNRLKFGVDYWHGETIVLGIHGPVNVDTATVKFTWPLTRRFEVGAHAGVSDITTLDEREATSYRTTLVSSWVPGGPFILAGSYGLDFQQGDVRRNLFLEPEVIRHVFRVSLTIAPRLSRLIQQPSGDPTTARPRR